MPPDLLKLLAEWRKADEEAFAAERAITDALVQQATNRGPGPTAQMYERASVLRSVSADCMERLAAASRRS